MTELSRTEDQGTANVTEEQRHFTVDGHVPRAVLFPESVEQVSEVLYNANKQRSAVVSTGLGAFLHLGMPPRQYDTALSLQRLDRILDYQPTDMTVTVEAGLPLARLQQILGEHGQWLPIDPPLPEQVTVGGLIATNLSGPARLSQGTIRDFLIGLKAVRADGTVIKGGGRVVKNVAGYDVPKLFCGSLGTLGVISEATFKVRPKPETQTVLSLCFPSAQPAMDFALTILQSELQPFFMELANFSPVDAHNDNSSHHLLIGFVGVSEEVQYQDSRVREIAQGHVVQTWKDGGGQLVQTLRDFPVSDSAVLRCKMSVLPDRVATFCKEIETEAAARGFFVHLLARAGNGIIFSRFTSVDATPSEQLPSFVDWMRILTKRLEGYLVVEDIAPALKERVNVWGHVGGTLPLMKRLKDTLDPNGILNPGRFVGGI
ncbi:MAG: FAD-binding oxidoreductase [Candidatus Binatia bacterium]